MSVFCLCISCWFYTLKRQHPSFVFSCRCQDFSSPDVALQEKDTYFFYWKQPTENRYMTYLVSAKIDMPSSGSCDLIPGKLASLFGIMLEKDKMLAELEPSSYSIITL